jgi:hypothetical protein
MATTLTSLLVSNNGFHDLELYAHAEKHGYIEEYLKLASLVDASAATDRLYGEVEAALDKYKQMPKTTPEKVRLKLQLEVVAQLSEEQEETSRRAREALITKPEILAEYRGDVRWNSFCGCEAEVPGRDYEDLYYVAFGHNLDPEGPEYILHVDELTETLTSVDGAWEADGDPLRLSKHSAVESEILEDYRSK